MGRGYSGRDVILDVDLQYEYHGHQKEEWQEIVNLMTINLTHATKDLSYLKTDFGIIKDNMENLARTFLSQNGNIRTEKLLDSIKADIIGNTLQLKAPAVDPRNGHPYAGHIEFGFTDRAGGFHGPWPFLRPAVHLAAQESTGMIGDDFAKALLNYDNLSNITFGTGRLNFGRTNRVTGLGRANRIANETREHFNAGRQHPLDRRNMRQWDSAYHGIKGKSSDSNFITNDDTDWSWGRI